MAVSWVYILSPEGDAPAVLRADGVRQEWARVQLDAPATDCVDGMPLQAGWWVFRHGGQVMSGDSLKAIIQGLRHGGSHSGMTN